MQLDDSTKAKAPAALCDSGSALGTVESICIRQLSLAKQLISRSAFAERDAYVSVAECDDVQVCEICILKREQIALPSYIAIFIISKYRKKHTRTFKNVIKQMYGNILHQRIHSHRA